MNQTFIEYMKKLGTMVKGKWKLILVVALLLYGAFNPESLNIIMSLVGSILGSAGP